MMHLDWHRTFFYKDTRIGFERNIELRIFVYVTNFDTAFKFTFAP